MIAKLVAFFVALAMTLGGTSTSVVEAQDLPEALQRANSLVYEMVKLGTEGQPVPQELAHMYQEMMFKAFGLAAAADGTEKTGSLLQIRTALQTQTQTMTMLRQNAPENADPLLAQVMTMLEAQNRLVDVGTTEPLKFNAAVNVMLQTGQAADKTTGQTKSGKQSGKGGSKGGK